MKARTKIILGLVAVALTAFLVFGAGGRLGFAGLNGGTLVLYGNVDIREVDLAFRVGGRIADLSVDEGDVVEAGAVLARLDPDPLADALRQAKAEEARQTAIRDKMQAGPRAAEIAQARALVAEREATLANAAHILERRAALVGSGTVTRQAYDDAVAARTEAEARLVSARRALDLALEGYRPEDIRAAEAALEGAAAARSAAETRLQDTILVAPANGIVLTRVREAGAIVAAGQTVFTLSLREPVWVRAFVTEPDLGRIRPGQTVEVVTDSRPDRPYSGRIGFMSPVAEFTPRNVETRDLRTDLVYRLRIVITEADADHGLRQGMPVTVHVRGGQ